MTDKDKLIVYDLLREVHRHILMLLKAAEVWEDEHKNALEAVSSVLYLAEGHFARMSD